MNWPKILCKDPFKKYMDAVIELRGKDELDTEDALITLEEIAKLETALLRRRSINYYRAVTVFFLGLILVFSLYLKVPDSVMTAIIATVAGLGGNILGAESQPGTNARGQGRPQTQSAPPSPPQRGNS